MDRMTLPQHSAKPRKADYLLGSGQVIMELKTLTTDTSHKVESAVEKHRERDDFPLFYGKANVRTVLARLPDGEDIYRRVVFALTRSVEDLVRSAEEQITHTREALGLADSLGLLVILNESVDVLDPGVVGYRVAQVMRRGRTGLSDSQKVDFVWLLFESHLMGTVQGMRAVPTMLIRGERADCFPWFSAFHKDLVRRWADANGAAYVDAGSPDPEALRFTSAREALTPPPSVLPRHEVWRRQYRQRPYLRHLSDDEVLAHGSELMKQLMPHFLDGGPGYEPARDNPLMERFTHFLEEAEFRALDMRRMPRP